MRATLRFSVNYAKMSFIILGPGIIGSDLSSGHGSILLIDRSQVQILSLITRRVSRFRTQYHTSDLENTAKTDGRT